MKRTRLTVHGIVQGVGFRPWIYRLAQECRLAGHVSNNSEGVHIEIEGTQQQVGLFLQRMRSETPPLAHITRIECSELEPRGKPGFRILASTRDSLPDTLISPDVGPCPDCLRELFDPKDRRYRYPFINCTNCGPRFTIISALPYDRPNTSMRVFSLCPDCEREFHDPADRRFHAQPNACPDCGPSLQLLDADGRPLPGEDPLQATIERLRRGEIGAIRGLGGFHLAVDALNPEAVARLRKRKGRAEKPFALMADKISTIRNYCRVSEAEARSLQQAARPIVLLRKKPGADIPGVAPGQRTLGFMLPATPLHALLLEKELRILVMTSANFSEEPIAIGNEEALQRLGDIADFFLLHDRDILQRCDDSIVRVVAGEQRLVRRARGFVPAPIFLPQPAPVPLLACGAELKNTLALARGDAVFLSQHIGDLDNPTALAFFEECIRHLQSVLELRPRYIVHDLHPEYLSTKWAKAQPAEQHIGVQHHHAHLAAVMAENRVQQPCIGIILDGTGLGSDGTIWGGEVLIGDWHDFSRFAWLAPVPLPGGGAAIRQPWRMAVSWLDAAGEPDFFRRLPCLPEQSDSIPLLLQMMQRTLNSPLTSSCGRLFDAVAAMLGLRGEITYEAQAAIELEMLTDEHEPGWWPEALPASFSDALEVRAIIRRIVEEMEQGTPREKIAMRFHRTLAELFVRSAVAAREASGCERVGLSGGVFQNTLLFELMLDRLRAEKFEVLTHRQVPANDGGIALGQIAIATARLARAEK